MSKAKQIPKYVLRNLHIQTPRDFRSLKRYQLKSILYALNQYRQGSAYCPGDFNAGQIEKEIKKHQKELSVKEWGR